MKKIFTGVLAFVLFAGAAQAQDSSRHNHKGPNPMATQLNLTADQQARLKSLREQQRTELQAIRSNTSLSAEQQKAQAGELRKKYRAQTEAIFTPDQKAQMEKMRSEWKAKGKEARKGAKGDHRKGGFKKGKFGQDLGLSQEQKDRMASLRQESRKQFDAIRNDKSLSDEQKKAKLADLRKQQHESMKSILTPEQQQKLQSMKKDRGAKNTK